MSSSNSWPTYNFSRIILENPFFMSVPNLYNYLLIRDTWYIWLFDFFNINEFMCLLWIIKSIFPQSLHLCPSFSFFTWSHQSMCAFVCLWETEWSGCWYTYLILFWLMFTFSLRIFKMCHISRNKNRIQSSIYHLYLNFEPIKKVITYVI